MTWTKHDKYCLTNGTHYLSRVNLDAAGARVYELWTKDGKTCLGIRRCTTDSEAMTAVAELKAVADELVRLPIAEAVPPQA